MVLIENTSQRGRQLLALSRYALYSLNFILALHLALVSYYFSTYLVTSGFPQTFVGTLYAAGSMVSLVGVASAPYLLKQYGNYTNMLVLGLIELLTFIGFVFVDNIVIIFFLSLISFVIPTLIAFSLDIFLESSVVSESGTSSIRGVYLTISSIAWVIAPLTGGLLADGENFSRLFAISALLFVPFIFIAASQLEYFKDPKYIQFDVRKIMKSLAKSRDLRGVFITAFLLRFFYGMMVIYAPLYLHGTLGISLAQIGIIMAVAITAFILLEIPIGKVEDAYWGEKEILILGFATLAITTASLSFITSTSVLVWAVLMFSTRVGAAMVEVSTEGHFFKQVDADDTDDVSAFRMLFPLAYIVSPLVGTLLLFVMPLQYIFLATGVCMLAGIIYGSTIVDSR